MKLSLKHRYPPGQIFAATLMVIGPGALQNGLFRLFFTPTVIDCLLMSQKQSRRAFFKTAGSTTAVATIAIGNNCSSGSEFAGRDLDQRLSPGMSREMVEGEIRRRADFYLSQRFLVVDYYRIRRKLAYPLPVTSLSLPEVQVPSLNDYPWATWMTWALEERVNALGWAAEWFGDKEAQGAATKDLAALAQWPRYRQYDGPDLSSGHAGRILWTACTKWSWLDRELRDMLVAGCRRHTEEVTPESRKAYGNLNSTADIRALDQPHRKLHNIVLIGTIAAALTGSCAEHSGVAALNRWIHAVFGANLDFRDEGFTEGVAYDGYVLDFIADWLNILSDQQRVPVLSHKSLPNFLEESYMLSVPGAAERVAELGDVEPKEMPFHISAQAKLYQFQPDPVRAWHLGRWRTEWVRSAGLGVFHSIVERIEGKAPKSGASNAHYAVVLRNGWDANGLAAVISCCSSPMGHLQKDNGTILIGTAGRWLITDPGYQQYAQGVERDFTLGPAAHNYPVLNGQTQSRKSPRLLTLESVSENLHKATLDLTSCYPEEINARSIVRTVWLSGSDLVVTADQLEVGSVESIRYHWHGHPEASWWCRDGWALVHTEEADLWLTSPQFNIGGSNMERLPGSRGQLTLSITTDSSVNVVWWIFVIADAPHPFNLPEEGNAVEIQGQTFSV